MNIGTRNRFFPFTAPQRQELEYQALIYKYIASGIPIPPDLLLFIRRSFVNDPSPASRLFSRHPSHVGWGFYEMGFGRKVDPEPGRCRRTDGKKWRCSKEAYPDSKYCERHMHRGKNRSRKPVEFTTNATNSAMHPNSSLLPTLCSRTSSSRSSAISPSAQDYSYPHSFLDPCGSNTSADNSYRRTGRNQDEQPFLELSGPVRGVAAPALDDNSWQLALLTETTPNGIYSPKQRGGYSVLESDPSRCLQLHCLGEEQRQRLHPSDQHCYIMGTEITHESAAKFAKKDDSKIGTDRINNKTVHKFFDEWPLRNRASSRESSPGSTTQLSVAVPASSYEFPVFDSIAHSDERAKSGAL